MAKEHFKHPPLGDSIRKTYQSPKFTEIAEDDVIEITKQINAPGFTLPVKGDAHPDTTKFPDHVLDTIIPAQDGETVLLTYIRNKASIVGYVITEEGQLGTITETKVEEGGSSLSPSATTIAARDENLANGELKREITTVSSVFPHAVRSVSMPDPVPEEFRDLVPTLERSDSSAGSIADTPTLQAGEISRREEQYHTQKKRITTESRDLTDLPVTRTGKETSEAFGFGGIMSNSRTLDDAAMTVDQGINVVHSETRELQGGLFLKDTQQLVDTAGPSILITNRGSGYTSATVAIAGSGTADAEVGYVVQSISIISAGTGYSVTPTVRISGGGGSAAVAVAILGFGIGTIDLSAGGINYASTPTVGITGGGGSGAAATAVLGFGVNSVTIINRGTGYTVPPSVSFVGDGSGASGAVNIRKTLASITVDDSGSSYTSIPSVGISGGGGTGAVAAASLGAHTVGIAGGGTGYANNDILNVVGGTHTMVCQIRVTLVSSGVIIGASVETFGEYSALPSNPVSVTGGGGTGATFNLSNWQLSLVTVTNAGHGFSSKPTIAITGGGGTGATALSVLSTTYVIESVTMINPGKGYTSAPTVSFDGDGSSGAATSTLKTVGSVVAVNVTSPGSGYTSEPAIGFSGGSGSGAKADSSLLDEGTVKSITVVSGGVDYRTTPTITLDGNATADAVLASTGRIALIELTDPGTHLTVPVVTVSGDGSGATAIYQLGSTAEWPILYGTHTDPETGIVIDLVKSVVPAGTLYPGEGFVDIDPLDKWRSIQIVSAVDLATLPAPESYETTHPLSLPDSLISIQAIWEDSASSKSVESGGGVSASITSSSHGDLIIKTRAGFRGTAKAIATRYFFFGPPPAGFVPLPTRITPGSGNALLISKSVSRSVSGGSSSSSDEVAYQDIIVNRPISDVLTGTWDNTIIDGEHTTPSVAASATNDDGDSIAVVGLGVRAYATVDIQPSSPATINSGQLILVAAPVYKWRFGVYIMDLIRATVP